jgi:hypothetical protein
MAEAKSIARTAPTGVVAWNAPEWTDERKALARKAVTPPSATEAEFEFFLAWCQRTGLDPFIKQAFLVERSSKVNGEWVKKHEPLAAESGMAARADALPDFRGMKCGTVCAGDVFAIDEEAQTVTHKWNLADRLKAGGGTAKVIGAWAHAQREGRTIPITWLPIETRIGTRNDNGKQVATQFWAKDPAGMISKCARAEQYRRAYPNIFGGVFIREELREEEIEVQPVEPPRRLVDGGVSSIRDRIVKPAATVPAPTEPSRTGAAGGTGYAPPSSTPPPVDMRAEAARAEAEAAEVAARAEAERQAKPPEPEKAKPEPVLPLELGKAVMRFGPQKGKLLSGLTGVDLAAVKTRMTDELKKNPAASAWRDQAVACLAEISAELEQREAALQREAPPEPGSEG